MLATAEFSARATLARPVLAAIGTTTRNPEVPSLRVGASDSNHPKHHVLSRNSKPPKCLELKPSKKKSLGDCQGSEVEAFWVEDFG